jgi:hypothetical protein
MAIAAGGTSYKKLVPSMSDTKLNQYCYHYGVVRGAVNYRPL